MVSTTLGGPAGATGANLLLNGETQGFAIDATTDPPTVSVIDTGTPANNLSNVPLNGFTFNDTDRAAVTGSNLTQGSTSPKFVHWSSTPYVRSVPHNIFLQSQTFGDVAWTKTRTTISADATTAPDGTLTADKLVEDATAANSHFATQTTSPAIVAGLTYNFSVYAKTAGQSRYLLLAGFGLHAASEVPNFNLDNGTVDIPATSVSLKSATITSVGNGWYRCSAVIVAPSTTAPQLGLSDNSTGNTLTSYNGDGASGLYIWGAQVCQGAYLHPYRATVASAWYGVPQGYDNTNSRLGILAEPAATNVALRSEAIDNASWATKTAITVTSDNTTAPDGASTADLVTTTGSDLLAQAVTLTADTDYTVSLYIKRSANIQWYRVQIGDGANSFQGWFDIQNGVVGSTTTAGAGAAVYSNSLTSIGNGWYRVTVSGNTSSSVSQNIQLVTANADGSGGRAGSGAAYWIWGVQLETGQVATSYIPTGAASVTRNADAIGCATSTYPHSATNGTFVAWIAGLTANSSATLPRVLCLNDGTTNEAINFSVVTTDTPDSFGIGIDDGGVNQVAAATTKTGSASTSGNKVACFYKLNDTGVLADAGTEVTDVGCTMPTVTAFNLGYDAVTASRVFNGYIYQMTYVPRRMTQTEMQTKTT